MLDSKYDFPDMDAFGTALYGALADRFDAMFSLYWSGVDPWRLRLMMRPPYSGCVDVPVEGLDKQDLAEAKRFLAFHLEQWMAHDWRDFSFEFPARGRFHQGWTPASAALPTARPGDE